jgi:hypothetical protein
MFLSPVDGDLQMARVIFDIFHGASGLHCNVNKSPIVPIWCDGEQIALAQSIFPCQLASFPLTYLDLLLSVNRLPRSALQLLLDKMIDKLPHLEGQIA